MTWCILPPAINQNPIFKHSIITAVLINEWMNEWLLVNLIYFVKKGRKKKILSFPRTGGKIKAYTDVKKWVLKHFKIDKMLKILRCWTWRKKIIFCYHTKKLLINIKSCSHDVLPPIVCGVWPICDWFRCFEAYTAPLISGKPAFYQWRSERVSE